MVSKSAQSPIVSSGSAATLSRRAVVAGIGGLIACPAVVRAAWPDKPISIVHGFPGGNADLLARLLADGLSRHFGATFVVETKPGAGGNIAATHVARSAPDGHTLLLLIGGQAVSAAIYNQLAYKPVDDFTMISLLTEFPFVLATWPDHPAKSGAELIALARKAPEPLLFGTNGNGTGQHMSAELFAAMAGLKLKHVPYRSSGNSVTDLLGQRIDFIVDTPTILVPLINDKQLRALAVTGSKRFFALPDVPTLAESGVAGYETGSWAGFGGPAGLPGDIQMKLNAGVRAVLADPATAKKLRDLGSEVVPSTPDAFKARLEGDIAKWTNVVRTANIPKI